MSTASSTANPCSVTDAKSNFNRLCHLIMEGGTRVLLEVLDKIHPPDLATNLASSTVKTRLRRTLPRKLYDVIYPAPGTYGITQDFDITLLCQLLRVLSTLPTPATGWNGEPAKADISLSADVVRLRHQRNKLAHSGLNREIQDEDFDAAWKNVKVILTRLARFVSVSNATKWMKNIDEMLKAPLTANEERCTKELEKCYWEEMELKQQVAIIDEKVSKMMNMCEAKNHSQTKQKGAVVSFNVVQEEREEPSSCSEEIHIDMKTQDAALQQRLTKFFLNQYKTEPQKLEQRLMWLFPFGCKLMNVFEGSIVFVIRVSSTSALEDLWNKYKNGQLKDALQDILITDEVKAQVGAQEIAISLEIKEDHYHTAIENLQKIQLQGFRDQAFGGSTSSFNKVFMNMSVSDSKEKSNGSKLSRLLINGGTDVLRSIFDRIHPPGTLSGTFRSHLLVLTNLRRKRVISRHQWGKLFPLGEVAPDSKNFDITLLFILLRNICGLLPPSTGWNMLPPATDTTLAANLARFKYFRNEVYGHISSTSISDSKFESYWKDISSALVALGLDQINVDLLKSEPIGSTDYIKLLEKWTLEEEAVKEVANRAREAALTATAEVRETRRNTEKLIESVESLQTEIMELKGSSVPSMCSKLAKYEFTGHVESLCSYHSPGTRQWILDNIQHHISNEEEQVTVITARPGVGKSVIAALTCQMMKEKDKLAACHFIEHGNSLHNTPKLIVESLASHLCESVVGFEEKLEEKLSQNKNKELDNMRCNELFTLLLEEPLNAVRKPPETALIVIDALDEIEQSTKDEFVKALFRVAPRLPKWIKLVVTTRPMPIIIPKMPNVTVIDIEKCCNNNKKDIILYLLSHLQKIYLEETREELETAARTLCNTSDGIFLFAHFAVEIIKEKKPSLSQVDKLVPTDISTVYEKYVSRLIKDLLIEEDIFFSFLEAVVASEGRLPKSMAFEILKINRSSRKEKIIARETLQTLSHLFPVRNDYITVFHKSLMDWLLGSDEKQHDFIVTPNDGHHVLAPLCFQQLQFVKSLENIPNTLNECEKYALRKGFYHMRLAGGFEDQLKLCVTDLELFPSILFASDIYHAFLIGELNSVIRFLKLSSPHFEEFINYLSPLYTDTSESCTQMVFQVAINCSQENEFRKQAMHLLGTPKYHHLPWIESTVGGWERLSELKWINDFTLPLDGKIALCIGKRMDNCKCFIGTFNTESRTCIASDVIEKTAFRCAISSAANYAVGAVTTDSGVKLFDLHTLQTLDVIKTDSAPVGCCFLSQGTQLAVGYRDCAVRVWDIGKLKLNTELIVHTGIVDLCIPLPGNRLLTGDLRGTLLLWQSLQPAPQHVRVTDVCQRNELLPLDKTVAVSPDETKIAVLCGRFIYYVVNLFSADDGQMLMQLDKRYYPCSIFFIDNSHIFSQDLDKVTILNTERTAEKRKPKFLIYLGPLSNVRMLCRINKLEMKFVGHCPYGEIQKAVEFTFHNIV